MVILYVINVSCDVNQDEFRLTYYDILHGSGIFDWSGMLGSSNGYKYR